MQSELYAITERYATAELGFICKIAEHMTANSNVVMFDGSVPYASMNAQQLRPKRNLSHSLFIWRSPFDVISQF